MTALPLTASPGVLSRRLRLSPGPAAAAQARARVRAAVRDWRLPVSEGLAVLLTWDLVTSVTTEGPGGVNGTEGPAGPEVTPAAGGPAAAGFLSLGISAGRGGLRVDVYDGRRSLPARGYEIVASLADDWGIYRTPAGRAVYFSISRGMPASHHGPRAEGGLRPPSHPSAPGQRSPLPGGKAGGQAAGRLVAGNTSAD